MFENHSLLSQTLSNVLVTFPCNAVLTFSYWNTIVRMEINEATRCLSGRLILGVDNFSDD